MSGSAEDGLMALLEAMLNLAAREARRPKPPPVKPGGFPEEQFCDLTESEKEEFNCNICYQVLKETMQCVNNHKFCHSCLLVWSTTGVYANRIRCPVCRTHGYYFRNNDIDDRIGDKKVKCHMETCKWSGLCKYLQTHRHTYGDEDTPSEDSATPSIPRLAQASPRLPQRSGARFMGTGLTIRDTPDGSGATASIQRASSLGGGRSTSQSGGGGRSTSQSVASTTSDSSPVQETVTELPRRASGAGTGGTAAPRRVPPVRNASSNRITFSHTGASRDTNNNVGPGTTRASVPVTGSGNSSESTASSVAGGFTPRPPSAPRDSSNAPNTRRLPRIVNPPRPNGRRYQPPEALALSSSTSSTNTSNNHPRADNLGEIRDRLQESRNRLDNLMSAFNGELNRNRAEMVEFQQERERQRREQLEEVRELGQRLGQVASELRRLLEHRRQLSSFSDDSEDDDDDEEEEE